MTQQRTPNIFEHRSVIPATMDQMMAFHNDPRALSMLTPPPIFVQLHRRDLKSLTEGEMEFTLWFGPLPIRWTARHEPGPSPTSFLDRMISGPVERWEHEHIFTQKEDGIELLDRLTIEYKRSGFWAIFTRLFFAGLPLRFLFIYRHLRTRMGVKRYAQNGQVAA
ncbi:MAG: hypothetical protein GYB67_14955 [Chloroflexi bacterium]|nr:hypothetical protein [Chloroflexota bacterium]